MPFGLDQKTALTAALCGLLTAMLFLAPLTLGGLGYGMSTFTAAPLFVAALGFGTMAGIVAGVVAAIATALFYGPAIAASLIIATAGPAIWIGHLAGLVNEHGEWFPLSGILARMAVIAAAVALLLGMLTGYDPETVRTQIAEITQAVIAQSQTPLPADEMQRRTAEMVAIIPFAFPAAVLLIMAVNLALAERFCRRRGWMLRPAENKSLAVAMPLWGVGVFAATAALGLIANGDMALAAQVIAGAFGAAFVLVGLATVHAMTRLGPPMLRPLTLGITYVALLIWRPFSIVLALLGVVETILGLRARAFSTPTKNEQD